MSDDESPVFETGMKRAEAWALLLELPWILAILAAAGLAFVGWRIVVVNLDLYPSPFHTAIFAAVLDGLGILLVLYAASFYPRKVQLSGRGIRFKMMLGKRELSWSDIESVAELPPEEAKRTFRSLRYLNLSPALRGAVIIKRKKGRPWVFSPEDPEGFVSRARDFLEVEGGAGHE